MRVITAQNSNRNTIDENWAKLYFVVETIESCECVCVCDECRKLRWVIGWEEKWNQVKWGQVLKSIVAEYSHNGQKMECGWRWRKRIETMNSELVIALNEKSIDIYWICNSLFMLLLLRLLQLLLLLLIKITNVAINRWFNVNLVRVFFFDCRAAIIEYIVQKESGSSWHARLRSFWWVCSIHAVAC